MSRDTELVHGSGNIYRDFGVPNPELRQLKALLAGEILRVLEERGLTGQAAHDLTGFAVADFSRIRRAKLDRFTVDRLMDMLDRLGQEVAVSVDVHPRAA